MSDLTLLDLPFDILSKIFKFLPLSDLSNVMLTCKTLKTFITEDNTIWRSFTNLFVRDRVDNRSQPLSFYTLCRVSRNWCNGIYKQKTLRYNTKYMPWVKFHNSEAVLIALGSKLCCYPVDQQGLKDGGYIWSVEVPKVERNDIRTKDISRFVIKNGLLVCGNRDGCAIVYKLKGTRERPCLLHHIQDCHDRGQSEVSAVELIHTGDVSIAVTASCTSPNLCYWYNNGIEHDMNAPARLKFYKNSDIIRVPHHGIEGLRCLSVNKSETKLAIGPDGNSKPLLVDVTMSKFVSCTNVSPDIRQAVRDVYWHDENTIAYVTHAGKLQLIDTRTFEVVYDSKDPFLVTLYCVKTDGDRAILAGAAEHSRCVLYDRRNAKSHVQMYFTSKRPSPVYSLDFDSTRLIAATDLNLVSLNFNIRADKRRQRDYSSFDFKIA
ncbi:F-box/WD repeat-containing protein 4 [Cydia amplana]|uniref:F-box/WD repeat-containing protein 4 n=1 Tax=Cydia amplana TaxID=1869771 RepID=UPI002FE590EA